MPAVDPWLDVAPTVGIDGQHHGPTTLPMEQPVVGTSAVEYPTIPVYGEHPPSWQDSPPPQWD